MDRVAWQNEPNHFNLSNFDAELIADGQVLIFEWLNGSRFLRLSVPRDVLDFFSRRIRIMSKAKANVNFPRRQDGSRDSKKGKRT